MLTLGSKSVIIDLSKLKGRYKAMDKMYNYKGHTITKEDFGFTVFWEGEEILFATDKEAENFIDENAN